MTWTVIPGTSGGSGPRSSDPYPSSKETKPSAPRATLLIVDDEPSICKVLSLWFSSRYNVIVAQSGEAALAIIRSENVDVMLIDLRIPDIRGDVIFAVAAGYQPHLRDRSLFYTGDITERAIELIAACGCKWLPKPSDLSIMDAAIAALTPRLQDAAG